MGRVSGRVAIVTGAGRGLGRAHALALAAEGASVVVNDLGSDVHGSGSDSSPAQQVVNEIEARGGTAIASGHDVADWTGAAELISLAVDTYGDLHVLVNNAGIVRDRTVANLAEDDWDAVIRVHLKGSAAPTRHATAYWRERSKSGMPADRSVVFTSSIGGLAGNIGSAAYATAKLGVLALSRVVSLENARHGVRSNVVSPGGRTRIALTAPGAAEQLAAPVDGFDALDPGNVSPLVVWLAAETCPATDQVLHITGDRLVVSALPQIEHELRSEGQWSLKDLDDLLPPRLTTPLSLQAWAGEDS